MSSKLLAVIIVFSLITGFLIQQRALAGEEQFEQYLQDGMRAYKDGNAAESERLLRLAATEAEGFPSDDLRLAKTLKNLATVCIDQDKLADAEVALRKALAAKEKVYGKSSPEIAATLNDLGVLCYQQAKYADAELFFQRVLDMDEKYLAPNHPERATTLENYAKVLRKSRRWSEAERLESRADQIRANPPQSSQRR